MKKIISLLIVSVFIVSCTNNNIETVEKEKVSENIPQANEETNTGVSDKENPISEDETTEEETTENVEYSKKGEDNKEEVELSVEDEKVLESEVNDLLDEFIDSLNNYDK